MFFSKKRKKRQALEDFRNFLLQMIFRLGELADLIKDSRKTIQIFLDRHRNEPIRTKVLLKELREDILQDNQMSERERIRKFVFEFFFIIADPKYSVELQNELEDDFFHRIDLAFDTNDIFTEKTS